MKNLKLKLLAAAMIAGTVMTTALPVCAAGLNASSQTESETEAAVSEGTAKLGNPFDYVTENGTHVIKDSDMTAYIYENGKSGVIIVENPEDLWPGLYSLSAIRGVNLSDIIRYKNGFVSQIYMDKLNSGIYTNEINVYGYSGNDNEGLWLKFMDQTGDTYSLHWNDKLGWNLWTEDPDWHYVDFGSQKPGIVRIEWEFTD